MGKMTFAISCEIGISFEKVKQFKIYGSQLEFIRDMEEKVRKYMQDFGEILAFKNELVDKTIYKVYCEINVSPELIRQFEKWGEWEFTRAMDKELRFSLNGLGEIIAFKNDLVYERDETSYQKPALKVLDTNDTVPNVLVQILNGIFNLGDLFSSSKVLFYFFICEIWANPVTRALPIELV